MNEDMMNGNDTGGDAPSLLQNLCDRAFHGSVGETAMVLGRTPEEIQAILNGNGVLDEDLVMKIRRIAQLRGVAVE
jgi:plasmid maintenance system antidote protein VapI